MPEYKLNEVALELDVSPATVFTWLVDMDLQVRWFQGDFMVSEADYHRLITYAKVKEEQEGRAAS